jgi:hypothetical protein
MIIITLTCIFIIVDFIYCWSYSMILGILHLFFGFFILWVLASCAILSVQQSITTVFLVL